MSQILKVDEWKSASRKWYVADVHTWTGWKELADILCAKDLDSFIDILTNKYCAIIDSVIHYEDKPTLIIFWWPENDYVHAHKFKLDINRIARQKGFMVD